MHVILYYIVVRVRFVIAWERKSLVVTNNEKHYFTQYWGLFFFGYCCVPRDLICVCGDG